MIDPNDSPTSSSASSSNNKDAGRSKPSGFLSHLIEMRDRLLKAVIVVAIAFIALFPFASDIYDWLAAPLGRDLIIIGPVAPFLIPMKLTLLVAFLIALPYLLYQLWSFVAPGLYKHEKRLVYPLLASSVFLFYLGIVFVYFVLLPMMFQIIPQFVPETADFKPDIAQYLDFVVMMFMAFGIGFEMPIATILLISTGMTTAEKLKKKRPYVIIGAFVVGMLLTPPDVVSQIMLAIPMWLLFELGLFLSKFFNVRVKEAGEASEARDKANSNVATSASAGTAIAADKLWEDETHIFEEDSLPADSSSLADGSLPADDSSLADGSSSDEDSSDDKESSADSDSDLSDEERSILNSDPLDEDMNDDEYLPDEDIDETTDDKTDKEEVFFDNEYFDELNDEEMEAELDRIEAQEEADKKVEKKAKARAKKRAEAKKKRDDEGP
ncbi:MAG: twin-arginine translocase subunit TatC [Cocleimonas sp.]